MPEQLFFLVIVAVAVACQLSKHLLLTQMKKTGALLATARERELTLRPCELAYLHSGGDLTRSLMVLATDLIQRALKQNSTKPVPPTAAYEEKMWALTRMSVSDYLKDKAREYVPTSLDDLASNPVVYVRRFSIVYKFFASTVRSFIVKLINDPMHIRKYFSWPGLARLVGDFASAGYQNKLESEMRADLLARGLIVPEPRRQLYSLYAWLGTAIAVLLLLKTVLDYSATSVAGLSVFGSALFVAVLLRGLFFLLDIVPFYKEVAQVASQIDRRSFRLTLVRLAGRWIMAILYHFALIIFAIVTVIAFLIFHFGFHDPGAYMLVEYICTMIALMSAIDLGKTGLDLRLEEYPTGTADIAIKNTARRISSTTPLTSFKEVLASTDYEPTFSETLALYGIELLLLLA